MCSLCSLFYSVDCTNHARFKGAPPDDDLIYAFTRACVEVGRMSRKCVCDIMFCVVEML